MYFKNRAEAAQKLATKLSPYRGKNPLILAIPRGAVEMGAILAEGLEGELDVVLVHKLSAPGNRELAVGSIDEAGEVYLSEFGKSYVGDSAYLDQEKAEQLATLKERRRQYTAIHPPIDPKGRIVIVIDDGVATGATFIAALRSVRRRKPAKLVACMAVAPQETLQVLETLADEVVCLYVPEQFYAVGEFFEDFSQTSDEEVVEILKKYR